MIFRNRTHAGRVLAKKLGCYAHRNDVLVLALPRGGVPVAFEVARARRHLDEGAPLVASLPGRCRWAVAGFWAGGAAALDAVAAQRFDPLAGAPRPARARVVRHMQAVLWSSNGNREAA